MNEENQLPQFAVKADLNGNRVIEDGFYAVDFSKLQSVNDLVMILACIGFTFHTTHPMFGNVKSFLDLDNPITPQKNVDKPVIKPFKKPEGL
jgi:hypothetical protein